MPQIPLDLADFILAYSTARTWFTYGRRNDCRSWDERKTASKRGVDSLRALRESKRLPRGVRALRETIEQHLMTVHTRYARRYRAYDALTDKASLATRYSLWLETRAEYEFWNHEVTHSLAYERYPKAWETPTLETHGLQLRRTQEEPRSAPYYRDARLSVRFVKDEQPGCRGGKDSWSQSANYDIVLRTDWRATVLDQGIANVEGRFVLEAKDGWAAPSWVEALKYQAPYVDRVWYGTWVEKGRGYELTDVSGLIVRLDAGSTFCVPFGTGAGGGYGPAFRKATKLARKHHYLAAKKARAS